MPETYLIGLAVEKPHTFRDSLGRIGPDSFPGHAVVYSGQLVRLGESDPRINVNGVYGFRYDEDCYEASKELWKQAEAESRSIISFRDWFMRSENALETKPVKDRRARIKQSIENRASKTEFYGWEWYVEPEVEDEFRSRLDQEDRESPQALYCLRVAETRYDNCMSWALDRIEGIVCPSLFRIAPEYRYDLYSVQTTINDLAGNHPCRFNIDWSSRKIEDDVEHE